MDPAVVTLLGVGAAGGTAWMGWVTKALSDIRSAQAAHVGATDSTLKDHEERLNELEALHPRHAR